MKLSRVMKETPVLRQDAEGSLEVTGLAYDSRRVRDGVLFFAIDGFKADGHDFIGAAGDAGAVAAVTGRWVEDARLPQLQVTDVRRAMASAAAVFYNHPSRRLTLVGVTGTNGKTTTTFLLDSIMRAAGRRTGIIGGVEYRIGAHTEAATRTTPEAVDSQRMLARALEQDVDSVVMEVSSHGIELCRIEAMEFDVAVFTNLSPDHLDLHGDMEHYFASKRRLFAAGGGQVITGETAAGGHGRPIAVINTDDGYGRRLAAGTGEDTVTFGLGEDAMVRATDMEYSGWETSFTLVTPAGRAAVTVKLPGRFNLHNSLAAAAAATALDIPLPHIAGGLARAEGVPGRFQQVRTDAPFRVIIDYAHNVAGLTVALETARRITPGRLIAVFGCPGERDREKRPVMGAVTGEMSDLAILTTDDCYGEDPGTILDEVEAGLASSGGQYQRYLDRRRAIEAAVGSAGPGDTILIAGKGHEQRQIMADGPRPFSDRSVVLAAIAHGNS
ncbi:UDP-N-acetylmuramoyl-L-alanyl-D-glutamate--L-lysine ligase [bacterium BMS3Abin01]|nr:UDP-N-acetylmuramoyl-L-alanyl-D-glutamate--L-lysine ligase [bacterium BMS3Abin01]HDY69447.1 UDP-N-acetylmuramoyl-L-alanyl-D-glutamate--2,6-diaminopimelate ligase [Actinomycetota bacterium]